MELKEGVDTYDEMTDKYVTDANDQIDMLLEAHQELEAQSVEAAEQVCEQLEEVQAEAADAVGVEA